MSNTPLYFIKKPTRRDLGGRGIEGRLYQNACWFSLQGRPTREFYYMISSEDLPENPGETKDFSFPYERPNNLATVNISLKVRIQGALVFELAMSPYAREIGIEFGEIFVIEQKAPEQFAIKIMKMDHPNYVRINDLLTINERNIIRNNPIQICTNINPFD